MRWKIRHSSRCSRRWSIADTGSSKGKFGFKPDAASHAASLFAYFRCAVNHLASMKGTVDRADMHYIIRDFDRKQFEARKRKMMEIAKKVGKGLHPDCYIELVIEDSYYNMREKVVEHPHILDIAQQAMRDCDIEPELKPIRGGTDGAQLSFMGLPCPNLFTGGYNYHGKHEFVRSKSRMM